MPEVAVLSAKITADTKDFDAGLKRANAGVHDFASGAGKVGGALGSIATTTAVAATALGGLAVGGFGAVVKTAATFSHSMSDVGAATGEAGDGLAKLRKLALDLGKDVQLAGVDANEAAKAIAELGRGGVSAGDLLDGAAKGGLLLFSAGAKSVESASQVAIAAMSNFGLTGRDVAHVADVIAAGANKSATSVDELGAAFNMSAAVASNAGLSLEELTGTLSFLAQKGLQGSDAGTSLKTALQRLQAPTDIAADLMDELGINVRDAQGRMLPMADIADVLKDRLGGLSDAQRDAALQTIFGADAIRVALPLITSGGDAIREWTTKVDDAGYAAKIGAQKNDDLFGSFEQLKATISTAAIEVGTKFEPALRKATDAGSKFINDFVSSPSFQQGLDKFATGFATGLDAVIAKLKDPAFQQSAKDWALALRDVAVAAGDLAGDIASTLGPLLRDGAKWFQSLDEDGRKNVVMFGLVAGAAAGFHKELGTLLSVGGSVVKMFAEKLAAKKLLTDANGNLATSAGKTATAFGAVKTAAATAAPAIAAGAAVTIAATSAWAGIIAGMVKYRDASGETVRMEQALISTREAMAFAAQHGATMENQHTEAFLRYVNAIPGGIHGTDELTAAWNRYLNGVSMGGQSTAGLTVALAGQTAAIAQSGVAAATAAQAHTFYNTQISQAEIITRALASGAPLLASGLNAAAIAASDLAVPVQASALAMLDLNSYGTPAQTMLNEFGSVTAGLILQVQGLQTELGNVASQFSANQVQMQGVSAESGQLGGWLQTLQGEWDKLDEAVKKSGGATDAQKARYAELAPLIQYLNGQQGALHATTVGLTEQQVKNWMAMQNLNASIAEGGAKAQGAQSALAAMAFVTKDTTGAASAGVGAQNKHAAAMAETQGAAVKAAGSISSVGAAIKMVPTSFTVTAHVDISGALAAISELNRNLPHSPAEEGPFRVLPNWDALFDQMPVAARRATGQTVATLDRYAGAMLTVAGQLFGALPAAAKIEGSKLATEINAQLAAAKGTVDAFAARLYGSGVGLVTNLGRGVEAEIPGAVGKVAALAAEMQATLGKIPANLQTVAGQLYGTGQTLVTNVIAGFTDAAPGVHTMASSLGADALAEFRKYEDRAKEAGKQLFGGVGEGLREVAPGIATMVSTLASDVARAAAQVNASVATMAAQFTGGSAGATDTKAKAEEIAVTLGDGLSVFDKLIPLKDKPSAALTALGASMDEAISLVGGLVDQAKLVREEALAFLWNAEQAALAIEKGLGILGNLGGRGGFDTSVPGIATMPMQIPALAAGGIVTKPTLALIGERGPEAVVPLNQYNRGGGGGGGTTVYLTVQYQDNSMQGTDRVRLAEFARSLKPELERVVVTAW